MHIAQRAAQNQRQRHGGEREALPSRTSAMSTASAASSRKRHQRPAHRVRRSGIGEQRESRAIVASSA